jgi:hypothetical protein
VLVLAPLGAVTILLALIDRYRPAAATPLRVRSGALA